MGRRKRDNTEDLVRAVLALILLAAIGLGGANPTRVVAIFQGIIQSLLFCLIALVVLALIVGLAWVLLRWRKASVNPNTVPFIWKEQPETQPYHSTPPDETRYSPPTPQPELFSEALVKSLEWRRFEILVQGLFRSMGFRAERIRAGADGVSIWCFGARKMGPSRASCSARHGTPTPWG